MDLVTASSLWDQGEVPDAAGLPDRSADPDARGGTSTAEEVGDVSSTLSELVREPQQERSRKTLRRIVDASYALLEAGGLEALTVGAIAQRARTSVGSFYARFDGKDELSRYLGELALGEVLASWEDELAGLASPGQAAEEEPDVSWEGVPPLLVALFSDPSARRLALLDGVEDPTPTRGDRLESRLLQDLLGLLAYPARPALHALVVARATLATAGSLARLGTEEEREPKEMARELGRLLDAYLRGVPAMRPDPDAEPDLDEAWAVPSAEVAPTPEPETDPVPALPSEPAPTTAPKADSPTEPDAEEDLADPFDVWA